MKNIWLDADDPRRCDNQLANNAEAATIRRCDNQLANNAAAATILRPLTATLTSLARRKATTWRDEVIRRQAYVVTTDVPTDCIDCIDFSHVQDLWQAYLRQIVTLASDDFWKVFLAMHTCTGTQLDSALHAIKRQFVKKKEERQLFPTSRRALMTKIKTEVPDFWPNVLHTQQARCIHASIDSICVSIKIICVSIDS